MRKHLKIHYKVTAFKAHDNNTSEDTKNYSNS